MFKLTSFVAAVLALTTTIAGAPLEARQNSALQDWQVTYIGSFTPSGRPGSYPWATIQANITDPNPITLGTSPSGNPVTVAGGSQGLNCQAEWFTRGESPLGRTWPCDPVEGGYWTLTILEGDNGFSANNFVAKFVHVADVLVEGRQYTASYTAQGRFAIGDNLSGSCGGSGVCSWSLKEESRPALLTPSQQ